MAQRQHVEAHAEAQHTPIVDAMDGASRSASSVITGPTTEGAKLIDQFGVGKVLLGFFLALFIIVMAIGVGAGALIRSDAMAHISEMNNAHREAMVAERARMRERDEAIIERHKNVVAAFKESRQDSREMIDEIKTMTNEVRKLVEKIK